MDYKETAQRIVAKLRKKPPVRVHVHLKGRDIRYSIGEDERPRRGAE